jgi:hypothetical protein
MTSEDSLDIREVIFINERCRVDCESMPGDVRESADQAIDALQNARPFPAKLCQPLHEKLSGNASRRATRRHANTGQGTIQN